MSIKEVYDWYAKEGYLNAVHNPCGDLVLYKYTQRTVFESNWNYHTKTARGLVLDLQGNIIARPWPKFFNLNEREDSHARNLPKDELPELVCKYDGSLIIVFWNPYANCWQAVTQGSWDNVQTRYAMSWLAVEGHKLTDKGRTYLFELIAPWNRIVVAYTAEQMVYLGSCCNVSGADESYADAADFAARHGWTQARYFVAPVDDIKLDRDDIVNEEGYVARFPSGLRVKLKYASYLMLHKILTGMSVKNIWENLAAGREEQFRELVPDEFKDWFNKEKRALYDKYGAIETNLRAIWASRPDNVTRKEMAEYFKASQKAFSEHGPLDGMLFRMLDGEPVAPLIWKRIKPDYHRVFKRDQVS